MTTVEATCAHLLRQAGVDYSLVQYAWTSRDGATSDARLTGEQRARLMDALGHAASVDEAAELPNVRAEFRESALERADWKRWEG
mgnify:CR=1 FL=1